MSKTFKALSALLTHPSKELQAAAPEITKILESEGALSASAQKALHPLLADLASLDLYEVQERFVLLFDRSRTLSLNLFEHVHGESRDRGPAMVDLLENYREGGFELVSTELPDHLPIVLEFLSTCPLAEAKEMLGEMGHIIVALAERLKRRETPYAAVLAALSELAGVEATSEAVQELLSVKDDNPEDLEALDDIWQEAEVTFGPDPNAGCPATRDMLANLDPASQKPRPATAGAAN